MGNNLSLWHVKELRDGDCISWRMARKSFIEIKEAVRITSWALSESDMETQRSCRKEQQSLVSSVEDREQICFYQLFQELRAVEPFSRRVCVLSDGKGRTFGGLLVESETGAKQYRKQTLKIHFEVLAKAMGQGMHFSCQSLYFLSFFSSSSFVLCSYHHGGTVLPSVWFMPGSQENHVSGSSERKETHLWTIGL